MASLEVFDSRVVLIIFFIHVPRFKLFVILHTFDELVSLALNRVCFISTRSLKQTLQFVDLGIYVWQPISLLETSRLLFCSSLSFDALLFDLFHFLGHALLHLDFDQVYLRFLLYCVCKCRHCIAHAGNVGEVSSVLAHIVDCICSYIFVAASLFINCKDAFHLSAVLGDLIY